MKRELITRKKWNNETKLAEVDQRKHIGKAAISSWKKEEEKLMSESSKTKQATIIRTYRWQEIILTKGTRDAVETGSLGKWAATVASLRLAVMESSSISLSNSD